jgi:nucleoid DNA-binding protein
MTKFEVIAKIAKEAEITQKQATTAVDCILSCIETTDRLEIRGFGVFKKKFRAERMAKNPKTGADVLVPAKNVLTFKSSMVM